MQPHRNNSIQPSCLYLPDNSTPPIVLLIQTGFLECICTYTTMCCLLLSNETLSLNNTSRMGGGVSGGYNLQTARAALTHVLLLFCVCIVIAQFLPQTARAALTHVLLLFSVCIVIAQFLTHMYFFLRANYI